MKRCYHCKVHKPLDSFHKNQSKCKDCGRILAREWNRAHKERHRANSAKRYRENPELSLKARLRRYGLSVSEFKEMEEKQGGRCAVCRLDKKLVVDHRHADGKIRGLVCMNCNIGIGQFRDQIELLRNAIEYLERTNGELTPVTV